MYNDNDQWESVHGPTAMTKHGFSSTGTAISAEPGAGYRSLLMAGIGGIVVLLLITLLVTYGVLEIKSGLRAYVTGESLWSKGRQQAIYHLDRYAETADPRYLARARDGLDIPLGDHQARLALQDSPPDQESAREGFIRGLNHPRDISRMIWMFRYFHNAPYFEEAISIWTEADEYILRLQQIADRLETNIQSDRPVHALRVEISEIQDALVPLEKAFSETLGSADHWLNRVLFTTVSIVLALVVVIILALFWAGARRLALSESELRATLENAAVGMAVVTADGVVQSINSHASTILGRPGSGLAGANLTSLPGLATNPVDMDELASKLAAGGNKQIAERTCETDNGEQIWLRYTFSGVDDQRQCRQFFILVIEDISETRSREARLTWQASHDPLTGVFNRREFETQLESAIHTASDESVQHALMFIDLDQFKSINDRGGHNAGDHCLSRVATMLSRHLRQGDVLARVGGDEFAVILRYCPLEVAGRIADQLRKVVAGSRFHWGRHSFRVTISIGVIRIDANSDCMDSVVHAADLACYQAKKLGRNCISLD